MTSSFLTSVSESLWTKEVVFCGLAAIGGGIVLVGLWLEWKSARKSEKDWFSDLNDFRSGKHKSKCGEILVMVGIGVEIVIAVMFAAFDVKDKYDINIHEDQSDTRNLPIQSIRGYARIEVRPKEGRETQFAMNLHQAWNGSEPEFSDVEMKKGETVLMFFAKKPNDSPQSNVAEMGIVAQVVFVGTVLGKSIGIRKEMPYVPNICFDLTFNNPNIGNPSDLTFKELKFVRIEGLGRDQVQLPLEVLGGEITIFAGAWPKTFSIPPQTNQFWRVSSFETNGGFVPAGYGLMTNAASAQN